MPRAHLVKSVDVQRTARVMQCEGIFDIPPVERSENTWEVNFELPAEWNVGAIVGPSGSGKSTVAREFWQEHLVSEWAWDAGKSILDSFPKAMGIKDITGLLSSVGFSSPPSWLRPFHALSNGEQFRVNMARTLAEKPTLAVVDEFTSVVDRTVAQIGSAAIQKTVRRRKQQFIAVSCHYDILDWLEPDWVYQPHTSELLVGRSLHQRPPITLEIRRVHYSAWELFRKHHYLDSGLNKSAACFVAFWQGIPVAFTAWLHFLHAKKRNCKRETRTVTLPDYQGVGIGNALSDYIASMWRGLGFSAISTTSSPSMINARNRSGNWKMTYAPQRHSAGGKYKADAIGRTFATKRLTASFEYVGAPLPKDEARRVFNGS